jgi:hypothetical protein
MVQQNAMVVDLNIVPDADIKPHVPKMANVLPDINVAVSMEIDISFDNNTYDEVDQG